LAAPSNNVGAGNSSHTSAHGTPNPSSSAGPVVGTLPDTENAAPSSEWPPAAALAPVENPIVGEEEVKEGEKKDEESAAPAKPLTKAQKKKEKDAKDAKERAEREAKERAEWDMLEAADDIPLDDKEMQDEGKKEDNPDTIGKPLTKAQKKKEKDAKEKAEKEAKEKAEWEALETAGVPLDGDGVQDDSKNEDNSGNAGKPLTKAQKKKEKADRDAAEREKEMEQLRKELEGDQDAADSPVVEGNDGGDAEGVPTEKKDDDDFGGITTKKSAKKKKGKK